MFELRSFLSRRFPIGAIFQAEPMDRVIAPRLDDLKPVNARTMARRLPAVKPIEAPSFEPHRESLLVRRRRRRTRLANRH